MIAIDPPGAVEEVTWELLCARGIAPTPRNFEVWFSYCADDKPRLRARLDAYLRTAEPLTADIMDALYLEFFPGPVDLGPFRANSQELLKLATQLADQVSAECGTIDRCGTSLIGVGPLLDASPTVQEIRLAVETLKATTVEAGDRMRALEQLLTASMARISELKTRLARAEKEATCDSLTGLANRRMFDAALLQATAEVGRGGSVVALLMIDIDHFKKFNDTHGHPMGDNVLRLVARILKGNIKGRDLAARYGGEEFAIILIGASLAAAVTVGEQIRGLLDERALLNRATGQRLGFISCSIGVALHRNGEPPFKVIERADQALYNSKRAGRNRVSVEAAD